MHHSVCTGVCTCVCVCACVRACVCVNVVRCAHACVCWACCVVRESVKSYIADMPGVRVDESLEQST